MSRKWHLIVGSHRSGTNYLAMTLGTIEGMWHCGEPLQTGLLNGMPEILEWRKPAMMDLCGHPTWHDLSEYSGHGHYGPIPKERDAFILLQRLFNDRYTPTTNERDEDVHTSLAKILFQHHPAGYVWSWRRIMELPIGIIYLKRNNILDVIISAQLAYKTNEWIVTGKNAKPQNTTKTVRLYPNHVLSELCFLQHQYDYFDMWFRQYGNRCLTVIYEDIRDNPEEGFGRIKSFMGLPEAKTEVVTKRQINRSQSEVVENYYELKEMFKGTKWADQFKD